MRLIGILMSKCYNIIIAGCLKCLKLVYCFANLISLVEIVLLIGQLLMYTVCSMQSRGHTPYDLPLISSWISLEGPMGTSGKFRRVDWISIVLAYFCLKEISWVASLLLAGSLTWIMDWMKEGELLALQGYFLGALLWCDIWFSILLLLLFSLLKTLPVWSCSVGGMKSWCNTCSTPHCTLFSV